MEWNGRCGAMCGISESESECLSVKSQLIAVKCLLKTPPPIIHLLMDKALISL